jgi:hypothetical protein
MKLWTPYKDGAECRVHFRPAKHRCITPEGKNYGISSLYVAFDIRRNGCGISWDFSPDIGMSDAAFKAACPDCTHSMHQNGYPARGDAFAGGVGFHCSKPMWNGHDPSSRTCEFTGGICYGDVGWQMGDQAFDKLRDEGEEALWDFLLMQMDRFNA